MKAATPAPTVGVAGAGAADGGTGEITPKAPVKNQPVKGFCQATMSLRQRVKSLNRTVKRSNRTVESFNPTVESSNRTVKTLNRLV